MSGPSTPKPSTTYALTDVLARTRDAYARLDREFGFVDVNPAAERALGLPRDALLGRTHWDVFPASVGTPVEAAYRRVAAEGGAAHLRHHYVGGGYDVHLEIDAYGTTPPGEVDVFWRDVTERVRAEQGLRAAHDALAEREREFRAMVDSMPTLAWTARPDGYIDWYNAGWYDYTGTTAEDMAGWGWRSVHDAAVLPAVVERWRASIATGAPFEMTFPLRGADGAFRPFLTRVAPVRDAAGRVTRWFGTNTDLTPERAAAAERERLLAESEAARRELEAANVLLQEQGLELELSNQQLQEQAAEVEMQAEALQATAVELELRAEEAEVRSAALRAGDARYRALLASIESGFCVIEVLFAGGSGADPGRAVDYRFVETNAAFVRQVGVGDPVGRRMLEIAPGHEAFWFETYGGVALTGAPARFRHEAVALGRVYDVFAYRVDDPALRRVAVLFADVTAEERAARERERLLAEAEAALAAADLERRRLTAVLEQLPVGVHVAEAPGGRIVRGNAAVRRIWGGAPASARVADYSGDYVAYHRTGPRRGEAVESHEWPLARALATGEAVPDEVVEARRPDGTLVLVCLNAAPVRDADGQVVGGVVTSTDVTERERLLAESEAERARAVEANQAKAQFLANMSHELRTPLNAIAGYAQLLEMGLHGPVTEAQRGALGRVQHAQQQLLGLINDVLNYAKLESGRVEYDVRPVLVAELLDDVAPMLAPQMAAKRVAFAVEPTAGAPLAVPLAVWADRDKLRQVLLNLLSNAVKFTDAGGRVTVGATSAGAGGADAVFLRVTDTGRGIAREKQEVIFEPFVQVGKQFAGESVGTGLGLAISRDLARGMGGDLRVRSAPGEGATFTVTLRRADQGAEVGVSRDAGGDAGGDA